MANIWQRPTCSQRLCWLPLQPLHQPLNSPPATRTLKLLKSKLRGSEQPLVSKRAKRCRSWVRSNRCPKPRLRNSSSRPLQACWAPSNSPKGRSWAEMYLRPSCVVLYVNICFLCSWVGGLCSKCAPFNRWHHRKSVIWHSASRARPGCSLLSSSLVQNRISRCILKMRNF